MRKAWIAALAAFLWFFVGLAIVGSTIYGFGLVFLPINHFVNSDSDSLGHFLLRLAGIVGLCLGMVLVGLICIGSLGFFFWLITTSSNLFKKDRIAKFEEGWRSLLPSVAGMPDLWIDLLNTIKKKGSVPYRESCEEVLRDIEKAELAVNATCSSGACLTERGAALLNVIHPVVKE